MSSSRLNCASEACDRCIAALTACVVVALPWRTCPIMLPSIPEKGSHHQTIKPSNHGIKHLGVLSHTNHFSVRILASTGSVLNGIQLSSINATTNIDHRLHLGLLIMVTCIPSFRSHHISENTPKSATTVLMLTNGRSTRVTTCLYPECSVVSKDRTQLNVNILKCQSQN